MRSLTHKLVDNQFSVCDLHVYLSMVRMISAKLRSKTGSS